MKALQTRIEFNESLARWIGVDTVALVREDLLPDGGGKKRRALQEFSAGLSQDIQHIHLLSYAGSHTALSLAQLLPDRTIHLYGTQYGGGAYERTMTGLLNERGNIKQLTGSTLAMTMSFSKQKHRMKNGHYFMRIGGSLGQDQNTRNAVAEVMEVLGDNFHHIVAVASGDLLNSILSQTKRVTGVLTQPWPIRVIKSLSLSNVSGLSRISLGKRMRLMKEISKVTGNLWDPIFMGVVFSYLKHQTSLPAKLCIWVTCPRDIRWD